MKKLTIIFTLFISFAFLAQSAMAASIEVKWTEPSKYRDVKPSNNGSRKHFEEQTFKNLEKHFTKLAKQLPENQTLKIEVTDVDLAGDVNHGGINRLRIIKEIYFPRIKFSYELVDNDKKSIVSGEVNLKDMNFMIGSRLKYRNDSLGYEKKMLDDWFKEIFSEYVLKKQ
jgi:hypothetical protein